MSTFIHTIELSLNLLMQSSEYSGAIWKGGQGAVDSRSRYVVQDQKQAVGLGIALPVVARAHGGVHLVVDNALPVEIGDHKLRSHDQKTKHSVEASTRMYGMCH